MDPDERPTEPLPGDFLPPEPSGREPDLGPTASGGPAEQGFLPPQQARPDAYAPSAQASYPAAGHAGPADQGGGWPAQPAGWAKGPPVPDNGDAVAGLILSIAAVTLLLLSVGLSSIISVVCAGLAIHYSRKGRARVERGETPKHEGVAKAGFVTGIIALLLAVLATLAWVGFAILWATDADFREDLKDELDDDNGSPDGFETAVPLVLAAARGLALLLR